jgi:hypothetical protein
MRVEEKSMSMVLSKEQMIRFASALSEQEVESIWPKVCLVADSPNLTRTVEGVYGKGARPDLAAVLNIARKFGVIHEATIVANPGLPTYIANRFERLGYTVVRGLAPDCDDRFVRKIAGAGVIADTLVVMGGDHCAIDVIRLVKNQRRPVKVVVIGVRESTAVCLKDCVDEFINLPVILNAVAA